MKFKNENIYCILRIRYNQIFFYILKFQNFFQLKLFYILIIHKLFVFGSLLLSHLWIIIFNNFL